VNNAELVVALTADSRFKDLLKCADDIVQMVYQANTCSLVDGTFADPAIAEKCAVFRQGLVAYNITTSQSDDELYDEIIRPASLLRVNP